MNGDVELHRQLYRWKVVLRTLDDRAVRLQGQGRIGTYAMFWGHEALQAGAVSALQEQDWIFPSYRESAIGVLRGMHISTVLAWWRGHPAGWWNPHEFRVASVCVPIATHLSHAVGLGWGQRLHGSDGCALVFFGDGATSEGAFHEAMNFASVFDMPVIFLCNNNGWAISTPLARQTKVAHLVDKAPAYAMPAEQVDGGDVLAVREATERAVVRARAGGGPTFIEAVTQRGAPHATADDPRIYADPEALEEARRNECLGRYERLLLEWGILDDREVGRIRREAAGLVQEGVKELDALPDPWPEAVFDRVYAAPLARDGGQVAGGSDGEQGR